jgi:hypothetical protein
MPDSMAESNPDASASADVRSRTPTDHRMMMPSVENRTRSEDKYQNRICGSEQRAYMTALAQA